MPSKSAVAAFLLGVALSVGESSSADLAVATPIDDFSESYDVAPRSSGLPLVGLRLVSGITSAVATRLNLADVVVALPSEPVQQICVRVTTQDARYMALNPYRISTEQADSNSAWLKPVSRQYHGHLRRYSPTEFAVKAYVSDNEGCSPVEAMHLPEIDTRTTLESSTLALVLQINSRGRDTSATLSLPSAELPSDSDSKPVEVKVECKDVRALAGLAFDRNCTLPLEAYGDTMSGKTWTLTIVMNDGFDDSIHNYSVYLP